MTTATKTRPPAKKKTTGYEVAAWIEKHCRFTQAEWIGQPFKLLPWQRQLLLELFETEPSGVRRYRWALVGVPKKNGKTELAAALALYLLIADGEPAPLVICAAASDDQADLVFDAAKTMCEMSPTLSQVTERFDREITVPSIPGAKLKRVAAVAGTNDGQNIHAVICDELHEWVGRKGENVWTVLTNSTGARRQPLVLQITTAGWDEETICGKQYAYGKRVREGTEDDHGYYFHWVEAPEKANYRDPKVWEATNPSYGVTVREEFFADQVKKKPENIFRRYFLNQWTQAQEVWIKAEDWDACAGEPDIQQGDEVVLGVDTGLRHDSAAVVVATMKDGVLHAKVKVWAPVDEADEELELWKVEAYIRECAKTYWMRECRYDPWYFTKSSQDLRTEGLEMVEFNQFPSTMGPATQSFYELVMAGNLRHGGDPTLRRHALSAVVKQVERGWVVTKMKSSKKIDSLVALIMAASGWVEEPGDLEVSVF